jgi:hypothetical protein
MSSIALITAVLASSAGVAFSQNLDTTEKRHFTFSCSAVYRAAIDYFLSHGIENVRSERPDTLSLVGSVRLGGVKPWTDAKGDRISDAKVYWIYTSKKVGPGHVTFRLVASAPFALRSDGRTAAYHRRRGMQC